MGLAIEVGEMELLSFLASLEANKKKGNRVVRESEGAEELSDRNLPNKA